MTTSALSDLRKAIMDVAKLRTDLYVNRLRFGLHEYDYERIDTHLDTIYYTLVGRLREIETEAVKANTDAA